MSTLSHPLPAPAGNPLGGGDSDRKRIEEALRTSESRFRQIAEVIDEVFWISDPAATENFYVSPAYERIWGRSRESLRGNPKSFIESIHPDDRERALGALVDQQLGRPFTHEYRIIRPDGEIRWVLDRGFPVADAAGRVTHFVGSCIDITARRLLEERERLRNAVLGAIARDEPLVHVAGILLPGIIGSWSKASIVLRYLEAGRDAPARTLFEVRGDDAPDPDALASHAAELSAGVHAPERHPASGQAALCSAMRGAGAAWVSAERAHTAAGSQLFLIACGRRTPPRDDECIDALRSSLQLLVLSANRQQNLADLRNLATNLEEHVRVRTDQARRQAAAMDATIDGLAIVQGDTYIYMNPAHARMYGYEPGELIGRTWMDIYDHTEVDRIRREIFPELVRQRHWSGETRGRRKDGTEITVDISLTITESGDLICACRDNTQRALQNEAIRRSQEQLELVLGATNDGFWDWSPEGVTYSPRWMEMLGYRPGELPQNIETWDALLHPDDHQRVRLETERFFRGDVDFFSSEYRLRTRSGGWCWVHDRGKVVARAPDGRALRAVGTHSDITARRTAELVQQRQAAELIELNAELARAARGRDEFLARVSHELRTPLASILAISEMILEGPGKSLDPGCQQKVHSIQESSNHLLDLINEILDLAKLEAGQARLAIEACDAAGIAQESIRLVNPQAQRQKLEIGFQWSGRRLRVAADPLRLKQMLVNLLSNAIKFTPAGGSVRLHLSSPEPGRVDFVVEDTGIGIDPSKLDTLFKPFVQMDSGLNRTNSGFGLGLAIVKHFAEIQHGSISVTSRPGAGSTFTIQLPEAVAEESFVPAPVPSKPVVRVGDHPPTAVADAPLRVMVVDDHELNRTLLQDYLTTAGIEVSAIPDGATALSELPQRRPDVIIMDVQMPIMDGLEVTRRIRRLADPELASLPILGLTAMAMSDDRARCLAAGMTAYQVKPFPLKRLPGLLRELAQSGHAVSA